MFDTNLSALDEPATLAAAEHARAVVEQGEVRLLQTAAQWADLHGELARATSPLLPGSEKLVLFGGDGTPGVAEFAPAELGVVLATSSAAAERLVGDALDLRHRLPHLWARICAGEVKPWIGRRTADATRHLSAETAAVVDRRIARYAHTLSWGRIEAIIAATWMECDPDAAAAADQAAQGSLGCRRVRDRCDAYQPVEGGGRDRKPVGVDGPGRRARNERGWLPRRFRSRSPTATGGPRSSPDHRVADLFADIHTATGHPEAAADPADSAESTSSRPRRPVDTRPDVTLYVHLTDQALQSGTRGGTGRGHRPGHRGPGPHLARTCQRDREASDRPQRPGPRRRV